ncbi:MAG: ABC transporter ATP-binding protein/permease [Candidatus Izemoplasmatales bacterium]|nr:ABC transporter ATP-binding protein/permease [Candidatus Izemoplasmatales bacterium]MDD3865615.1 ABC transporter ATP-binding protein/permease [Candidatus Izemoplasmatales bacterium]
MIKLVNVSKYYSSNNVIALGLRKANLELSTNEFVAIVGESGSGKTTLLNVICGIDTYEEGEIYLNGEETSYYSTEEMEQYRKKYVAFVFQTYNLIDSYTVLQNVEAPMILAGYARKEIRRRALEIIDRVGLSKHVHHKATKLSGGQKQRVVIARALAKDCPIIAADEPTGNLDSESGKQILELLHEISKDKLVIVVTHDFDQIKQYATRKIRIYDGEIVEDIAIKACNKQPLPTIDDSEAKIKWRDIVKMSFANLLSQPKKTIFLLLLMFLTTFFIAWEYGSFNRSTVENAQSVDRYYQPQFLNIGKNRIVIRKVDGSILSAADILELSGISGVKSIIDHDYIIDQSVQIILNYGDAEQFDYYASYATYNQYKNDAELLLGGKLPEADDEVVMILTDEYAGNYSYFLDSTISIYLQNGNISTEYDVVGVFSAEDLGIEYSGTQMSLMFSEAETEKIQKSKYIRVITNTTFSGVDEVLEPVDIVSNIFSYYNSITIDDDLPDNTIVIDGWNYELFEAICSGSPYSDYCITETTGTLSITDFYFTNDLPNITIEYNSSKAMMDISMNTALYEQIFPQDIYQVSLFADDDVAINSVLITLGFLYANKYNVTYPYEQAQTTALGIGSILYMFSYLASLISFILIIGIAILVTYLILKLIFNTKMRDYTIFRTIGADKTIIKRFITIENLITTVFGFLLFLPLAIYLKYTVMEGNALYGFHYYQFGQYFILLGIMLLIALINSRRYGKRVFKESVNKTLKQIG